jgi:hypothetical protein
MRFVLEKSAKKKAFPGGKAFLTSHVFLLQHRTAKLPFHFEAEQQQQQHAVFMMKKFIFKILL